jgi:hypothetical protein
MLKSATHYSREALCYERLYPVASNKIEQLIQKVLKNDYPNNWLDIAYKQYWDDSGNFSNCHEKFKNTFIRHLLSHPNLVIKGLDSFAETHICLGCTNYIDNLYISYGHQNIQILAREYPYHVRMHPDIYRVNNLNIDVNRKHLIVSMPFVAYGDIHPQMYELLDLCYQHKINVHVDCAWLTAARDIEFDFSHPAIHSVGISMSKGYGTGWNRVGLRFTKEPVVDSISLNNDYVMLPGVNFAIANFFLDNIEPNHLWNIHEHRYMKLCQDFNLTPTKCIQVVKDGDQTIGTSFMLRYLETHNDQEF